MLHRCIQRHGISQLPKIERDAPNKRKFMSYPLGYFHIEISEVRTEEGCFYLSPRQPDTITTDGLRFYRAAITELGNPRSQADRILAY